MSDVQDVYLSSNTQRVSDPTSEIEATTDVLEPLSDEIFVYLFLTEPAVNEDPNDTVGDDPDAGSQLLMSVDPASDIDTDESVRVVLDRSTIHLFDTTTGESIRHGLSEPRVTASDGKGESDPETEAGAGEDD